ncbi:hypothetical protein [Nocardioides eburneiflavus]|uniref:hypothetical protein n=1 Tax=Nocardioides eburneiflavus TaxID=2518372 RepID=UPI001B2FE70D|nr:hypothetical protein [Nocardioides eburneiflavus]
MAVLLMLCGCGGGTAEPEEQGNPVSNAADPMPTDPGDEVPAESDDGPVAEESDRPAESDEDGNGNGNGDGNGNGNGDGEDDGEGDGDGDGDGDGEDDRVLVVGGPTLDNTFPTNPFALPDVGRSSCVMLTNRTSDLTVTVESVRLVNLEPAGNPGLQLGSQPDAHPQCGTAPGFPGHVEGAETYYATCVGAELEPEEGSACPVEVRSVGVEGTDYTGRLVLVLSATCTSAVGEPCDRLVGRATPTVESPVTVVWEFSRRYSSCLAPHDRSGAEFLSEESEGRCPTGPAPPPSSGATESPSEPGTETEPGTDTEAQP